MDESTKIAIDNLKENIKEMKNDNEKRFEKLENKVETLTEDVKVIKSENAIQTKILQELKDRWNNFDKQHEEELKKIIEEHREDERATKIKWKHNIIDIIFKIGIGVLVTTGIIKMI